MKKAKRKRNSRGRFVKKAESPATIKPIVKTQVNIPINTSVSKCTNTCDPRLDEIMPLIIEMVTRLLNSVGMQRYRADFISKVKEIMDGKK